MANMKTLTQDDRAKLARAYINGGSAPYQAARQTGFMRVSVMQEAIKSLEKREAEEAAEKVAQDPAPAQTIYPFLPPGHIADEPYKRPLYALHTRDISVKRIGTAKPEVQIVLLEKRHTLSIPVEKLEETITLLQTAWELEKKNG